MGQTALVPFRSSPFALMAEEATGALWAGRENILRQLKKLCRTWTNASDSTLDLMWANLGAGKTHALFHVKHLLSSEFAREPETISLFVELPEHVSHFIEVYRLLVSELPLPRIAELVTRDGSRKIDSRIQRASRAIARGDDNERELATDWICGGRPGLRQLKSITGIDARIEDDADAEHVLANILRLLADNRIRVVFLVDEFQRIVRLPQRAREALLAHIRGLFSRTPSFLSVVLAVGSRVEKTAIDLLPPELRTIMGMKPAISLPEMSEAEAREFIIQRLNFFRPEGYSGSDSFPFSDDTLRFVLSYLAAKSSARLIPRTILQVLGIIYNELILDLDHTYSQSELAALLDSLRWDDGQA